MTCVAMRDQDRTNVGFKESPLLLVIGKRPGCLEQQRDANEGKQANASLEHDLGLLLSSSGETRTKPRLGTASWWSKNAPWEFSGRRFATHRPSVVVSYTLR